MDRERHGQIRCSEKPWRLRNREHLIHSLSSPGKCGLSKMPNSPLFPSLSNLPPPGFALPSLPLSLAVAFHTSREPPGAIESWES